MFVRAVWVALCVGVAASHDSDDDKVVYGTDNRLDVYELPANNVWVGIAKQSIAGMISKGAMGNPVGGVYTTLNRGVYSDSSRLGNRQDLCSDQKFRQDPTIASCSGTLVAPDRIVTAGHCINKNSCGNVQFLFNYYVTGRDGDGYPTFPQITNADIYDCRDVYSVLAGNEDIAIVHLDRPVDSTRHTPVSLRTSASAIPDGRDLAVIGCGSGVPFKIDTGGEVIEPRSSQLDYFQATLDTFAGNSGSGVFQQTNNQMVGVLVRGATDYRSRGSCTEVNVISSCTSNCGEDCTYAYKAHQYAPDCVTDDDCDGSVAGDVCYRECGAASDTCTGFCYPTNVQEDEEIECGDRKTGSTVGADNTYGDSSGEHIYQLTLEQNDTITITTCQSEYDTQIRVYNDNNGEPGSEIAGCDDCGSNDGCALREILDVELDAGVYHILIEGAFGAEGAYVLELECESDSGSTNNLGLAIGVVVAAIIIVGAIAALVCCCRKNQAKAFATQQPAAAVVVQQHGTAPMAQGVPVQGFYPQPSAPSHQGTMENRYL